MKTKVMNAKKLKQGNLKLGGFWCVWRSSKYGTKSFICKMSDGRKKRRKIMMEKSTIKQVC